MNGIPNDTIDRNPIPGLDFEDKILLDPPDPVDLLIAHAEDDASREGSRPLDFVRAKFYELKKENRRLRDRVADLEQTLSIVQTAQEWTLGKGMTPDQAEKMREIKSLLEQAKKTREEIQNFSGASKASLFEKLRGCKLALKREREEKREMKDRLQQAFDRARTIKEQHQRLLQQRVDEHEQWQEVIRDMKDRHRAELRRLRGDPAAGAAATSAAGGAPAGAAGAEADRQEQIGQFSEQVLGDLNALQQHLRRVRQETVDSVIIDNDDLEDPSTGFSYPLAAGSEAAFEGPDDLAGDGSWS